MTTFDALPQRVDEMAQKLDRIEKLLTQAEVTPDRDFLMTIEQLIDYLPEHPARQTIYQWVNDRKVPYEKFGKRLYFRKTSIDTWLDAGRRMTAIVKPLR